MEVELVQMTQATTSQTASSTGNGDPAGDEQSGAQWEGHDSPDSESGGDQGNDDEGGNGGAPQYLLAHQVPQEEKEAMAEKGDMEKAS